MSDRFTVRRTPGERRQDPAVPWDTLPQEALVKVFSYLCDGDRLQASLACKAWHRVLGMARLWRLRSFCFRCQNDFHMRQVCYDGFFREHGQHLQQVILEFASPNRDVVRCFQAFVAKANECTALRLLTIKIVRALCLLLKRQPMLQEADFYFCQFTHNEGLQVLKAVTGDLRLKTRRNITTLSIREFFQRSTLDISLSTFTEVMGRFSALAYLRVDQHYLCDAVLDKLITGCAQTLRHLDIVMNTTVVHAIDSHTWSLAVQRCPSLTVTVRLHKTFTFEEYSRVLVASMPLTRVILWGRSVIGNTRFADVARFLGYVSDIFFHTIEVVDVKAYRFLKVGNDTEGYLEVDEAVEKLIETCVRLKRLLLCIPLMPETLDKLSRVLAARAQNEMKRLEVKVLDEKMSPEYIQERWPALRALSPHEIRFDDF
ncbi:F-box only protein 39-like isoform X2 [Pomacea canaliculata]|uniref:F-box only protein 39-like isoform X2 n=1 Tax=Pomacea canaliculata TaxID=400727 RepID=UPI000D7352BD|nr:F-box only protein 39-like isoform X2 [Pomacea canaliculata]